MYAFVDRGGELQFGDNKGEIIIESTCINPLLIAINNTLTIHYFQDKRNNFYLYVVLNKDRFWVSGSSIKISGSLN